MNKFIEYTSKDACGAGTFGTPGLTMDYYDGNTVTGIWNYAQNYAMSDNHFSTGFGPSTPGALNLVAGQTHGATEFTATGQPVKSATSTSAVRAPDANGVGTVNNDPDPVYGDCSNNSHKTNNNLVGMQGKNIGDLLNSKNISWGWFQGGFTPTAPATASGPASCGTTHTNVAHASVTDYSPHHEPFQHYASTTNPHHLAPASPSEIGHNGQANHQYDTTDFSTVVNTDNMRAVSFLKAASYEDGHPGYSDPIDEQNFITKQINAIEQSKNWDNTAIVLAYDDYDGWYDHVASAVKNSSNTPDDAAWCQTAAAKRVPAAGGYADRCGPGPRQPLVVISPYAKKNFVDHTQTTQTSADATAGSLSAMFNFNHQRTDRVLLDEQTGAIATVTHDDGSGGGRNDNSHNQNNDRN